jgi:CRP/FNR family cyclic AMP-dependent transcriptional regulator
MVEVKSFTEMLMFAESNPLRFDDGEVIFREGDAATKMYIVREGEVELRRGSEVLELLGPGSIVGEMALIDPAPRSATVVAKGEAKLVAVDEATFRQLVQKVPGFALEVLRVVVRRLRKEMERA